MPKTAVISFRIDEETLAMLDRIAAAQERSRAWIVGKMIRASAEREAELLDFVDAGLADLDAGRALTDDELVARIDARRHGREAA